MLSKKNKFGEKSKGITIRIPESLMLKLGPVPGARAAEIVCDHFGYEKPGKFKNFLDMLYASDINTDKLPPVGQMILWSSLIRRVPEELRSNVCTCDPTPVSDFLEEKYGLQDIRNWFTLIRSGGGDAR